MTIIQDLESLKQPLRNPVLTIGNFDGVHRGHLALFDKVKQRAVAVGGQSVVMTFEPHPLKVIKKGNGPPIITPMDQKLCLIRDAGIEVILCVPFTRQFAEVTAESFVQDILVGRIGVKEIVVGHDYTFGRDRLGNTEFLQRIGGQLGIPVHLVEPVQVNHTLVSSTSIRKFIQEGNLSEAKRLLGRDFQVWGTVIKGANRGGRLLGYPTANLRPTGELIPRTGVYAVTVEVDDRTYAGVTNVGYNPTFKDNVLSLETHLLDFNEDLVGETIKVTFIHRIRPEKTFASVKELAEQISRDVLQARELLRVHLMGPTTPCEGAARRLAE